MAQPRFGWISCTLCLLLATVWPAILFAQKISAVEQDGTLRLDDGKVIRLAGIQLADHALQVVRAVVTGQDVDFSAEKKLRADGSADPVYLFVKLKETSFGEASHNYKEEKVMLNELLIKLGEAKVLEDQEFKEKDNFLKLQSFAKEKGEGLWSFSPILSPPKK